MDLTFRKATKRDLSLCADILVRAHTKIHWRKDRALARLSELLARGHSFCVLHKGRIIGFAFCEIFTWVDGKDVFVGEMAIAPAFQRQGAGRKLVGFLEGYFRRKGCTSIELVSTYAVDFYRPLGFKKVALYLEKKL